MKKTAQDIKDLINTEATLNQRKQAERAARWMLKNEEWRDNAISAASGNETDKTLIAFCIAQEDRVFQRWLKIETEQYKRIGGTHEDSEANDGLHDQASNFAYDLILEEIRKASQE